MKRLEKEKKSYRRFVAQAEFPVGTKFELVRDPKDGLARLLLFDPHDSKVYQPNRIKVQNTPYLPVDEPEEWIRRMRLPLDAILGMDVAGLIEKLATLFAPLGPEQASLLSAWALSTWKADSLPMAPQLFVTGTGAVTVLRALAAVCRRAVLLQAQSGPGSFPAALKPTLLATVPSPRVAQRLFAAGSGEQPVRRGSQLADQRTACAAAYSDDAKPIAGVLNIVAEVELEDLTGRADELQNQLLGWRLQSTLATTESPEVADPLLRNLLLTCSSDAEIPQRIEVAYAQHLAPIQVEVDHEEDAAMVAALRELISPLRTSLYVAEIAREAERKLLAVGSYLTMTPRRTGEVLRRMGIETERLGAMGRGVRLTKNNLERIKQLVAKQEVPNPDDVLA